MLYEVITIHRDLQNIACINFIRILQTIQLNNVIHCAQEFCSNQIQSIAELNNIRQFGPFG